MSADLFEELEGRIDSLVYILNELKVENIKLKEENDRLSEERGGLRSRVDSILKKLEGV